jgi:hypothetical protein
MTCDPGLDGISRRGRCAHRASVPKLAFPPVRMSGVVGVGNNPIPKEVEMRWANAIRLMVLSGRSRCWR